MNNFIPEVILLAKKNLYSPNFLNLINIQKEKESQEYQAYRFNLNKYSIIFRKAKITPLKLGQFVTSWKRSNENQTIPFDNSDSFDFFIIHIESDNHIGQFIFPKKLFAVFEINK